MDLKEITVRGIDIDLQELLETLAEKMKADGCTGCKYKPEPEWKMPCRECKRGCKDRWEAEE